MEHMAGFWLGGTTFGKKVAIINSGIKPFQNRIRNEHAYPLLIIHYIPTNLHTDYDLKNVKLNKCSWVLEYEIETRQLNLNKFRCESLKN